MPRGAYTAKQDRKAEHIEKSYEKRGVSKKEAESRAWATVNKQDKGGKNDGSGRSPQPQRRRQERLGNPPQARRNRRLNAQRSRISIARSIARSSLCARRSSLSVEARAGARVVGELVPARLGQAKRKPAAVVGSWRRARPGRRGPGFRPSG